MATVKDPICGKDVDTLRARAVGIFGGVTYYFCSAECKSRFKDPRQAPRPVEAAPAPEKKKKEPKKDATPAPKKDPTPAPRKDPSIELGPMKEEPVGDEGPLPDLTPEPMVATSPSVEVELAQMRGDSRRWAIIIAVLAILVFLAAMLFLR